MADDDAGPRACGLVIICLAAFWGLVAVAVAAGLHRVWAVTGVAAGLAAAALAGMLLALLRR